MPTVEKLTLLQPARVNVSLVLELEVQQIRGVFTEDLALRRNGSTDARKIGGDGVIGRCSSLSRLCCFLAHLMIASSISRPNRFERCTEVRHVERKRGHDRRDSEITALQRDDL